MKRIKLPGENISLKTKKNESEEVMAWINSQSNLMDSIRYLIENEVRQHGVRNLQQFVPADRSLPEAGALPTWARAEVAAAAEHAAALAAAARQAGQAAPLEAQALAARSAAGAGVAAEPAAGSGAGIGKAAEEVAEEDIESWM
jgi:hypothetical protein